MRKLVGSDVLGYWEFYNEPNAHVVCEKNVSGITACTAMHARFVRDTHGLIDRQLPPARLSQHTGGVARTPHRRRESQSMDREQSQAGARALADRAGSACCLHMHI